MNRKSIALFLVAAAATLTGRAGALVYDEQAERVTLALEGKMVVFQFDTKANGFVTQRGDWIAWDTGANGWLLVPKSGPRARFDAKGDFIGREQIAVVPAPQKPVKAAATGGYDPTSDAGDSGKDASADTKTAFDYLAKRDAAIVGAASNSVAGDSGGGAIVADALGGDDVARKKQVREAWKMRPGAHQSDPEGVLETGAVKDPLQSLMDSMQSLSQMASGVEGTIQGAQQLKDQVKDFGHGNNYQVPPMQPVPGGGNNPMPPAGGGQQPFPPQGGYPPPGYGQQPGYGGTLINNQLGGYGGSGVSGGIGGKPPGPTGAIPPLPGQQQLPAAGAGGDVNPAPPQPGNQTPASK